MIYFCILTKVSLLNASLAKSEFIPQTKYKQVRCLLDTNRCPSSFVNEYI